MKRVPPVGGKKASVKSNDRARLVRSAIAVDWRGNNRHKLESVKDGFKLVIDQQPEYIYNKEEEIVGVDAWVRMYGPDGNVVPIDPHRRIINPPSVSRSGIVETDTGKKDKLGKPIKSRELVSNPTQAFYEAVWDSVIGTPNPKGWRTRGTVTTVYADATDGYVYTRGFAVDYGGNVTTAYNQIRAGNVTGAGGIFAVTDESSLPIGQGSSNGGGGYFECYECFVSFDTSSSIGAEDTLDAVTLSLWMNFDSSDSVDFNVEARARNWGGSLATDDYVAGASLGNLTLRASLATSGIGAEGEYKAFTSEASFINDSNLGTGTVPLILFSSRLRAGNRPQTTGDWSEAINFASSDEAGTSQDPKLDITHTSPFSPSNPIMMNRPNRIWRRR